MQLIRVGGSGELQHDNEVANAANGFRCFRCLDRDFKNPIASAKDASQQFEDAPVVEFLEYLKTSKDRFCMIGGRVFQSDTQLLAEIASAAFEGNGLRHNFSP
jgi:hypothetical protein